VGKNPSSSQSGTVRTKNDIMLYSVVTGGMHEAAAKSFEGHPHSDPASLLKSWKSTHCRNGLGIIIAGDCVVLKQNRSHTGTASGTPFLKDVAAKEAAHSSAVRSGDFPLKEMPGIGGPPRTCLNHARHNAKAAYLLTKY